MNTKTRILIFLLFATSLPACGPAMHVPTPGMHASTHSSTDGRVPPPAVVDDNGQLELDGKVLYAQNCALCHGTLSTSDRKGASLFQIYEGFETVEAMSQFKNQLSLEQVEALVEALKRDVVVDPTEPEPIPEPLPTKPTYTAWSELQNQSCKSETTATRGSLIEPSQFQNAILDIFGISINISGLPNASAEFYKMGDNSSAYSLADLTHLETLFTITEKVAADVKADLTNKAARFVTCKWNDTSISIATACQTEILTKTLSKIYRRKLTNTDPLLIKTLSGTETLAFQERYAFVIRIALMMPEFLYRFEYDVNVRGTNGSLLTKDISRPLSNTELASRLSFMIWNSVPDDALLEKASKGELSNTSIYQAEVERMLKDQKASRFVQKFTDEWLDLKTLSTKTSLPGASPALLNSFQTETRSFMAALFNGDADFKQFYNSEKGFLTQRSFAAITASGSVTEPIFRGAYTAKRLLCLEFGNPPANAASINVGGSTKLQVIHNRAKLSSCNGCHSIMDPIGYSLESLGPLGQFRTYDEQNSDVGVESLTLYSNVKVKNPTELGAAIAEDSQAGICLSQMLYKYATRAQTAFESSNLNCQINNATHASYANGNSIKDYVSQVTKSPMFLNKLEVK